VNSLLANRTARRRGVAYVLLLAITLILMAFSSTPAVGELQRGVGFAFRPVQGALNDIAHGVTGVFGALAEIDELRQSNAALLQENARLAAENERLAEIKRENEQLTALLQLRSGLAFKTVAAQVIARESSELKRIVTLDQGTDKGIKIGDVVIAAGGALAGRVTDAGPNFARVRLMNDGQSTVVGQIQNSAATGEVVGQLGGVLVMQNIDATERPKIGDEVVTAGIELSGGVRSPYPKGLLIGQVVDVRRDANAVVQTAYLDPAVELDKLEYVLVITDYQGGLPPADEQPTTQTNPDGTLPDSEQPFITASPGPSGTPHASPTNRP
jgi:rod shape-determining protein MreC